ncbi:DUF4145 domain-containing protein [Streptococcus suis]|nr:DUF4145 domain-containing protein [Streptococcus suis]
MLAKAKYGLMANSYTTITITDICPDCGRGIEPVVKDTSYYKDEYSHILYLTLFCNACKHAWVDSYDYDEHYDHASPLKLNLHKAIPNNLPSELVTLSPQGAKIYNQSLMAENDGYDTLVGIGLRKSLEFFIKDFLSVVHPSEEDEIRILWLGNVIKKYIADKTLQDLATATAYIGNDETHYTRVHTSRDLQDLKKFLSATLRYIEYQLTILDVKDFLEKAKTQS